MIYEQSCRACEGDLVLVHEQFGIVFWCIGCGLRTEMADALRLLETLKTA